MSQNERQFSFTVPVSRKQIPIISFLNPVNIRLIVLLLFLLAALVGCSRTESDWKQAQATNTVPAYTDFIAKHPDATVHVPEAKKAIEELNWQVAKDVNTVAGYKEFITKHPQTLHIKEADAAIEGLDWKQAKVANTIAGYKEFITKHPQTLHIEEANAAIEGLDWNVVKGENTVAAFNNFVAKYPKDPHVDEAKAAIESLDWMEAGKDGTPTSYLSFYRKYPTSTYITTSTGIVQTMIGGGLTTAGIDGPQIYICIDNSSRVDGPIAVADAVTMNIVDISRDENGRSIIHPKTEHTARIIRNKASGRFLTIDTSEPR
jgi:outer membrane protein assembly factor BamD (BamD/ComL family)